MRVPDVSGMSESDARKALTDAGFSVSAGRTVYSTLSQGTIVYTSPGAGTKAMRGSDVSMSPSTGYVPPPPPVRQECGRGARSCGWASVSSKPARFRNPAIRGRGCFGWQTGR